jgi:hypothetical protein
MSTPVKKTWKREKQGHRSQAGAILGVVLNGRPSRATVGNSMLLVNNLKLVKDLCTFYD